MRKIVWGTFSAITLLAVASASAASFVFGDGLITSSIPGYIEFANSYENPVFLDVARSVDIPAALTGSEHRVMSYFGEALFGRLSAFSSIGGAAGFAGAPNNLGQHVEVFMGFEDEIETQNLPPLVPSFLRLDVELGGRLYQASHSAGPIGSTSATFLFGARDLLNQNSATAAGTFGWSGNNFPIVYDPFTAQPGFTGFVPYPGGEVQFTPSPLGGYSFGAHGYIDVPLFYSILPSPIQLRIIAGASSTCGSDACAAFTDFGNTALIGNARIVDQNGDPMAGVSFTSASGYNYITPPGPPGPPAVPEPASMILAGAGLAALLGIRARRNRTRSNAQHTR